MPSRNSGTNCFGSFRNFFTSSASLPVLLAPSGADRLESVPSREGSAVTQLPAARSRPSTEEVGRSRVRSGRRRAGSYAAKLAAFDLGVDDILTTPFSPEELLARTMVIARRALGVDLPLIPVIRLGEIDVDIVNSEVRVGPSVVHLSPLDQSLLYLLASRAGRVVTHEEILDAVWGTDFIAESNIVDRHIRSLRVKLQDDYRHPRFIETIQNNGYRFIPTFSHTGWSGAPTKGGRMPS